MILDIAPNFIRCPNCGGFRFYIRKTYEIMESKSNKYDNMLDAVNEQTLIICNNCKQVVSNYDGVTKVNYHTNQ